MSSLRQSFLWTSSQFMHMKLLRLLQSTASLWRHSKHCILSQRDLMPLWKSAEKLSDPKSAAWISPDSISWFSPKERWVDRVILRFCLCGAGFTSFFVLLDLLGSILLSDISFGRESLRMGEEAFQSDRFSLSKADLYKLLASNVKGDSSIQQELLKNKSPSCWLIVTSNKHEHFLQDMEPRLSAIAFLALDSSFSAALESFCLRYSFPDHSQI